MIFTLSIFILTFQIFVIIFCSLLYQNKIIVMNLTPSIMHPHLQQNPQAIMRNQLNKSPTKMQYTFNQSQRFPPRVISASPAKFYDLPSLWPQKGTSIGKSNRTDFSKQNVLTPSPNKYQCKSSFMKNKTEGITMGLGRDEIKYRDMFEQSLLKTPDPLSYHPQPPTNTKSYSLAQKLNVNDNKWLKQVPGPGNYGYIQLTNSRNKKSISKYLSAQSAQFSKGQRVGLGSKNMYPGPGHYDTKSQSFEGSIFDKAYASKIGNGQRRGLSDQNIKTPGPGTYQAFSQFLR